MNLTLEEYARVSSDAREELQRLLRRSFWRGFTTGICWTGAAVSVLLTVLALFRFVIVG